MPHCIPVIKKAPARPELFHATLKPLLEGIGDSKRKAGKQFAKRQHKPVANIIGISVRKKRTALNRHILHIQHKKSI